MGAGEDTVGVGGCGRWSSGAGGVHCSTYGNFWPGEEKKTASLPPLVTVFPFGTSAGTLTFHTLRDFSSVLFPICSMLLMMRRVTASEEKKNTSNVSSLLFKTKYKDEGRKHMSFERSVSSSWNSLFSANKTSLQLEIQQCSSSSTA